MKKIMSFFFLLFIFGCSNNIKIEEQPKPKINYYSNIKNKNIEFLGLKNNSRFINQYGYSYFTEDIAFVLEKQGLALDRAGFIVDNITLDNLNTYKTDNRYLLFGEVKDYDTLFIDNKEDVGTSSKVIVGLLTYGIGAGLLEAYDNTNRKTFVNCKIDINFYLYDKKENKIIKKIPISIEDKDIIEGSWSNTSVQDQDKIYTLYFIKIFNQIGDKLFLELN
ncbi:hypothetical protein C4N20_05785 [Fusobacterium ulcerans]|uniref:Lipoprotein n=1 Tax=Fusobacterium ulcerans TaxID=861 RepID=A0AAX2JEP1_9FUSO|nr:hypothetical protein [Fusobacterium ulcerans]AVQ27607.1 hypothetical protein C4N20_05785 [Fusobacterium ulcerans]EFS27328.1 hypothetical protein FUAG_02843 [Fusobacterium ulcerans ATCC 49185]SQJ15602.1 Uncharacterised protein [Fusobacterium ulcerans]